LSRDEGEEEGGQLSRMPILDSNNKNYVGK